MHLDPQACGLIATLIPVLTITWSMNSRATALVQSTKTLRYAVFAMFAIQMSALLTATIGAISDGISGISAAVAFSGFMLAWAISTFLFSAVVLAPAPLRYTDPCEKPQEQARGE